MFGRSAEERTTVEVMPGKTGGGYCTLLFDCVEIQEQYDMDACSLLYDSTCDASTRRCVGDTEPGCGTHVDQRCSGGDVYWFDACGRQEERSERCEHGCTSGACEAAPACSLTCSSDSYTNSCGTGSSTTNYSYCSSGNVSAVTVRYSNGHTVTCNLNCSGSGGTCRDDTGASCSLR